jgi:hypothetical protein
MSFQEYVGCILKGPLSALPVHATYWTDFLYYATDNGDLYLNNGTAWIQLQGATKAEVLKNKVLDGTQNNIINVGMSDPFSSSRREGYITPAITGAASLTGALKGLTVNGTYSYFRDTTEGYVSRFTSAIQTKQGFYSDTNPVISRREWATRLKVRMRSSTLSNTNIYVGFSNAATTVTANTVPFFQGDVGILMGFNISNANFMIARNDGIVANTGTVTTFPVAKDTNFHTFEMVMSDTNIVLTLDDANPQTYTTVIPPLTTDMKLVVQMHGNDALLTRNFDVAKGIFSSDIT